MDCDVAAHLLWTVDDEITTGVQRTLVELAQISIRQAAQQAVGGAKHDGNFTDEGLLVLSLQVVFAFLYDGLCDVDIQGGGVPEVGGADRCKRWGSDRLRETTAGGTYVRFRSRASLGIMGDGAPSLSQWVGLDR